MTAARRLAAHAPHPNTTPSPQQLVVLRYLARHLELHGWMPSRREILHHLGASPKSLKLAQDQLEALEKKGFISIGENVSRGIRLMPLALAWLDAEKRKGAR